LYLAASLAAMLAASVPTGASAQTLPRHFPQNALRAKIAFRVPPDIQLDGDAAELAPGARIHGTNSMLVLSGQLVGSGAVVDYTIDLTGRVSEVWILTPDEAANEPWPRTAAEATAWTFAPLAQTWTKP
jgi:hypothetical protein